MSESYLEIQLDQQPIELYKLLKIADLVSGGGEAKVVISEGYVLLNGEVEYQKRKKVYHNDIVEFNEELIQVIINEELNEGEYFDEDNYSSENEELIGIVSHAGEKSPKPTPKPTPKSKSKNTKPINSEQKKAAPTIEGTAKPSKRKPISF
jgi:ribosome-associated protein